MARIIIFGAGENLRWFLLRLQSDKTVYDDEIVTVVDNDTGKWNKCIGGYMIQSPKVLNELPWDEIIVSCKFYSEIVAQLSEQFGIDLHQVMYFENYLRKKMVNYQYAWHAAHYNEEKHFKEFDKKSVVVYTTIFGDYDVLHDVKYVEEGFKYICFTDNRELKSDIWEIRYVDLKKEQNIALKVREYKIMPHRYFPDYDTSIWIDGNFSIVGSQRRFMEKYQRQADILFFPHYERNCVYSEIAACMMANRAPKSLLMKQMRKLLSVNYPEDNGLLSAGYIVRNHNEPKIVKAMEEWYEEVRKYSQRDQISLPYILYKNNLMFDICNEVIFENEWLQYYAHK